VEYNLETASEGTIEIIDVSGNSIRSIPFEGKQDQITVITNDWNAGIYIASITVDGKTTESIKFTLVK